MQMTSTEEVSRFCDLLRALLCSDNARRSEAEKLYQATKQSDPDRLCKCLITVLTQAPDDTLRQQSAVLLRQCLKASRVDFVWPQLPPNTQDAIKAQLLVALKNEPVRLTRNKICDAVSMLATHVLDPSVGLTGWPCIAQELSQLVEANDSNHRESAVRIVKDMLVVSPQAAQSLINGRELQVLQICHVDPSPHVRKESVLLFAALLEQSKSKSTDPIRKMLPAMLAVVKQFGVENLELELQECLEAFVQTADSVSFVFQQHMNEVVPMMTAIARARNQLADGVRQLAFEFLTSLSEKRSIMCSKFQNFIAEIVSLCMEFMLELEEDLQWAEGQADADNDEVSNYDVGHENIDRVARAFGAEQVLDHVFNNVRQFVTSSWKHKYVAIMTLSQCVEQVQEESQVDEIVMLLIALLGDDQPRVRFAALHAIGQTSTDHSPYLQENHHEKILPALARQMQDPVVRVASHACAAFVNFAEDLECEVLLPHVPDLMAKLSEKMVSPVRVAREQAITAIAVIAGVIEHAFVPYYQHVVPVLKQVVLTATKREERALRGKAFECMSLLGLAVGRTVFRQDAKEAMQAMMEIASAGFDSDDPQKSYIYEAAQRVCRALKEDFLPYLSYLLPGIYAMLQMQPVQVVDPDAEEQEDMTIDFLQDGKAVGLKTSQIEDFRSAVQMLRCFLEVLGGHFFDYIQESARCLMAALKFRFSDDVKREAISTWQELLCAARAGLKLRQISDDSLIASLLRAYLSCTLEAMRGEEDLEILQVQAAGTSACIKAAAPGSMTPNEVQELCVELKRLMDEASQLQWYLETAPDERDDDEQAEAEQQRDADQTLRIKYVELAGTLMEVHKASFLSGGLQQFVPIMQEYLAPGRGANDRCIALYIADDVLEKLGSEGVPVWPVFMDQMVACIRDDDPWVRQAALYGVLYAARIPEFGQFADQATKVVCEVVGQRRSKADGHKEVFEAAAAALGSLCKGQAGHISGLEQNLVMFLDALPLVQDLDQAGPTHELLMQLVQERQPFFQKHINKVCRILLDVYNRENSTEALNAWIRQLFRDLGDERLKAMNLPERQRKRVVKILRDAKKAT